MQNPIRTKTGAITETIRGIVDRVTYHNPDNGWSVLRVEPFNSSQRETVTVHQTQVLAAPQWNFVAPGNSIRNTDASFSLPGYLSGIARASVIVCPWPIFFYIYLEMLDYTDLYTFRLMCLCYTQTNPQFLPLWLVWNTAFRTLPSLLLS